MKRIWFSMLLLGCLAIATILVPPLSAATKDPKQEARVLIMLGPPGSGKGTQASIIQNTVKLPHISTGDLLRENISQGTNLGKEAKTYMEQGKLVPDPLILDMLFDRVSKEDCQAGYILDGFPRTVPQAEALQSRMQGPSKVIAINLDVPDEEIVERLSNRVVCSSCGATYHLTYLPPKKEMTCDQCQSSLIQRSDDKESIVRERLKVYHEQTKPVIGFYEKQKTLETVVCSQTKEKITKEILSILRQNYSAE